MGLALSPWDVRLIRRVDDAVAAQTAGSGKAKAPTDVQSMRAELRVAAKRHADKTRAAEIKSGEASA